MPIDPHVMSSYLQNLPAIFSDDPFLGRFLLAFEQVLTGLPGLAGKTTSGLELDDLEQLLRQAIWSFEPRLLRS